MASHDRALIDRLVDKLIIVEDGQAAVHLGNYEHFRWKHRVEEQSDGDKSTEDVLKIRRGKEIRENKKARQREERRQQRQLEEVERDIESIEALLDSYQERFAAIDPGDYQKAQQLKEAYDGYKADLDALYEAWEELAAE